MICNLPVALMGGTPLAMRTALKMSVVSGFGALCACSSVYEADPTTYAHLNCAQLQTMYNPSSELLIPRLGGGHPGDSSLTTAKDNNREWTYQENLREERSKFRSDVRAAYRDKGC